MKSIRRIHLYLGCFFAPLIVAFAFTGLLQTFELHESAKDGSYVAPHWLVAAASVHKHAALSKASSPVAMRVLIAGMSVGLAVTTVLGIVLAFQSMRRPWLVGGCVAFGIILPVVLLALA
jgi:hypothetical protein